MFIISGIDMKWDLINDLLKENKGCLLNFTLLI